MNRRICYVGTEITPSEGSTFVGGHVNTVVRLCKGLSHLGWEIHIVTTPSRFLKNAKFDFPWGKIYCIKAGGRYSSLKYRIDFFMKAIRTIENLNRNESFDLVHAHSGYFSLATVPTVTKRILRIPALFSLYCPASLLPTRFPMDKYEIKFLSDGLDKVIAVSDNVKKSLMKCGVCEDKIEVIPPCIDEEVFNPFTPDARSYEEVKITNTKTQTVLFIGNINRTKGLDVFLKAAESILRRNLGTKFLITLHESYETIQHVRVVARSKLGSSVAVMGVVNDMASLMADADVIVAPFRSTEGIADIPLIVLEAMAMGKPVVASNLEGIREVICDEENGLLVEPDVTDDLANAIIDLLKDSKLKKEISERASSSVKQFSYTQVSQRLGDLYLKVLRAQ